MMDFFGHALRVPLFRWMLLIVVIFSIYDQCRGANGFTPFDPMPEIEYKKLRWATYYDSDLLGNVMANGERFNPRHMVCASYDYPLNTWIKVTNIDNNKSVIVKVADRHDWKTELDLSFDAYLNIIDEFTHLDDGHVWVTTERIER